MPGLRLNKRVYLLASIFFVLCALPLTGYLHLLLSSGGVPRKVLYQSQPGLLWTNVVMSGLTAMAYATMFGCMMWIASRLRPFTALQPYLGVFLSFATFIGVCGLSQLMAIITFWWAFYPLSTSIKVVSASASIATAVFFLRVSPRLVTNIASSLQMLTLEQQQKSLAQETLRESEEKLGFALLATNGIGTWSWDFATDLFSSDATVAVIYGVDPAQAACGVPIGEYMKWLRPEDVPQVLASLTASLEKQVPFLAEYRIVQPDRPVIWVAARGQCTRAEDGSLLSMNGVVVDITERKWSESVLIEAASIRAQALEAEKILHDNHERLQLMATTGVGIWEVHLPRNIVFADAVVAAIFGFDPAVAAAGMPRADFIKNVHPDDGPQMAQAIAAAIAAKSPYFYEYRLMQPGGSMRWLSARGQCKYAPDGTPLRFTGVVADITDKKWAEQVALETARAQEGALESERMLRETEESLNLAFVGTWDWDVPSGMITSNPVFARFYGLDPQQGINGAPFAEFSKNIPPEDLVRMEKLVDAAIQTGEDYTMEHRVRQADGSLRWVAVRARCKYAEDGTPLRFPGVSIDITDRKRSEDALVQTERQKIQAVEALIISQNLAAEERLAAATRLAQTNGRFRLMVEGVKDHALLTIDTAGLVTSWNLGAERLLGYAEEEIVGHSYACIFLPEDIADGVPKKLLDRARETGQAEDEGWRMRANGSRFWASVSKTAFISDLGTVAGFAVIIQDTTERKKVATVLEEARRERARLQEKFLSHVSHELRTPLTAIYFFTSNVADGVFGELAPEQREHLRYALENVTQLKEMVSDLLDITRVDTHKLAVEPQYANPNKLIGEVRSTCLKNASEKNIQLSKSAAHNLPAVWADCARVRQILTNLVDNGIKFTPEGGRVSIHARYVPEEPDFLRFSVTDTGCGIAPQHLEVVFDRLAQVSENPEMSRSGLGLGLFIASELVAQHGGRIWVESSLGQGSTFFFTLPIFSLAKLCAHVLTPHNLALGSATLIAVDLVAGDGTSRAELLPEIRKVLSRCVHPGQDVLLPWLGDSTPVMTFFIVACTDNKGFSVIASRIGMELRNFGDVARLRPLISSTTVVISPGLSGDRQVREVTERFEHLIETHLQGQEKSQ